MKFVKSKFGSFDNSVLGLKLSRGDVIVVTDEIEESAVYQQAVATKNFVPVVVSNMFQFGKIVNATDELTIEFRKSIAPKVPEELPEPVVPDPEPEEQITFIHGPEVEEEFPEEEIPEVKEEEENVVAFTEIAGNIGKAKEAVNKETDIEKLKHARIHDDRITIKKAITKRIEELE